MKKILIFMIAVSFSILNVHAASDYYYINDKGVKFTEEQYNYFSKVYYEGYQEYMNQDDFNYFDVEAMDSSLVEEIYLNNINNRATSITDNNKSLKITKTALTNTSIITTTLSWNSNPTVKSYDVIGARLSNTSLTNTPITKIVSSSGTQSYSVNVNSNSGFGASVLLTGNNIKVTQTFTVNNGGTVYASYQHAKSSISLANSQKYTISSSGYGKVFAFTGTASSVYDAMSGVSISV